MCVVRVQESKLYKCRNSKTQHLGKYNCNELAQIHKRNYRQRIAQSGVVGKSCKLKRVAMPVSHMLHPGRHGQSLRRNSFMQKMLKRKFNKQKRNSIKVAHASSQLNQISTNNAQKIQRAYQARQTNPGDTGGAPLRATHR